MKIREVKSWIEAEQYSKAWNGILTEISADIVFMNFDWLKTWWEYHGLAHELYILVMVDGGKVLGFVPLMREKGRLYDTIGFVGGNEASYTGIIARDEDKERVFRAALDYIRALPGRLLFNISGFFKNTRDYSIIKSYLNQNGIRFVETGLGCYFTEMGDRDFNIYLRSRLGRGSIHTMKRKEKRLKRLGSVSFEPLGIAPKEMETVFTIHDKRWERRIGYAKFSRGVTKEFFRELALSTNLPFTTEVDIIRINDRIIAFIYGFEYGGRYIFYRIGHDDDFGIFSPGEMVLREKVRDCFERGIKVFDFGAGHEPYKTVWGEGKTYVTSFLFPGSSGMAKAAFRYKKRVQAIKNWIKRHPRIYYSLKSHLGDIKYMLSSRQGFKALRGILLDGLKGIYRGLTFIYSKKNYRIMKLKLKNENLGENGHRVREATIDDLGKISSISGLSPSKIIRRFLGGDKCLLVYTGDRVLCLWYSLLKIDLGEGVYSHTLDKSSVYIRPCTTRPKDGDRNMEVLRAGILYLVDRGYTKFYMILIGKKSLFYSVLKSRGFQVDSTIRIERKMGRVLWRDIK